MNRLIKVLKFKKAVKKPINYELVNVEAIKPCTFAIVEKRMLVDTILDGIVETRNVTRRRDIIVSGTKDERYVISIKKFIELYDVNDGIAIPRQNPRWVARVGHQDFLNAGIKGRSIEFIAPWGETMVLNTGDYLVKDTNGGFYRIEKTAFKDTYIFLRSK